MPMDLVLRLRIAPQADPHILHLKSYERAQSDSKFLSLNLHGRAPLAASDLLSKPPALKRVVGQEEQLFIL